MKLLFTVLALVVKTNRASLDTELPNLIERQIQYIDELARRQTEVSKLLHNVVNQLPKIQPEKASPLRGKGKAKSLPATTTTTPRRDEEKTLEGLRAEIFRQANALGSRPSKLPELKQSFRVPEKWSIDSGLTLVRTSQILQIFLNERAVAAARLLDIVSGIAELSKKKKDALNDAILAYASDATEEVTSQTTIRNGFKETVRELIPLWKALEAGTTTESPLVDIESSKQQGQGQEEPTIDSTDDTTADSGEWLDVGTARPQSDQGTSVPDFEAETTESPEAIDTNFSITSSTTIPTSDDDLEWLENSYVLVPLEEEDKEDDDEPIIVTMEDIDEAMRTLLGPLINPVTDSIQSNDPDAHVSGSESEDMEPDELLDVDESS